MAALIYAAKSADCPYEIVLVTGDRLDAPGLDLAEAEGVPVARIAAGTDKSTLFDALDQAIRESGATYVALAGFMRILPADFVARWDGRLVNIHPSLLPAHKGLRSHAAVLAAGERVTGCTVHLVSGDVDGGPILGSTAVAVLPGDTADALAERVLIAEHQLYPRILAELVAQETSPEALLDRVRELALALPAAEEKLSHGSPGFFVTGGKFFAYFSANHHGDGRIALKLTASGVGFADASGLHAGEKIGEIGRAHV